MSCLVGLLACGSMCGPCLPGFPVALLGALSAYSRGGGFGIGPPTWIGPHRIPVSSPCALRVWGTLHPRICADESDIVKQYCCWHVCFAVSPIS